MDIIIGVGAGVALIGGLIVILNFVSERPKRVEVQDMIDRSIASIHTGITEIKDIQRESTRVLNNLVQNIGNVCPYGKEHKKDSV